MKTHIVWLLMALTLMLSASQVPTRAATNSTSECGAINTDTTWSLANSPYAVCVGGVTVASGATLTLEPGVVVQFQQSASNKLNVQGALDATGTPTQPITFTGVVTTPGSWGGLNIIGTVITPALASLSNVTLDYGGINGSFGAQVYADRAVVTMTHSLIRNSAGNGLYTTPLTHFDVHTTHFVSNSLNAIQLNQPTTDLLMTDLSASGNGVDGVRVVGTTSMPGQRRWMFPGVPYIVDGPVSNVTGNVLTIDPGNELRFTSSGWLSIGGQFNAIGLPDQPITLTSQTKLPGDWRGIFVYGSAIPAVAQLDYTTVEYGGNDIHGANIEVGDGVLIARHSIIRYSSQDGVRFDANAGGSILNSQIFSNSQIVSTTYGVHNSTPTRAVLATNNWWGDANGPTSDLAACSTGHGDRVTAGVLFRPVLTDTQTTAPFPLSDAPILTLTPRRWFAPADNTTRVYFDITLRDGNGAPLPGRTVKLSTSLGTAKDGGITDLNGKTLAYLVSNSVGDADVTATLDAATTCEGALSPTSKVTFTPPLTITDLLPNAPASYFDGDISITPLPVVAGITTTIQARLTNPLSVPITVDVSFGFVQSSIGLAFGPIQDNDGQVIPANSRVTLTAPFMPIVSGHYCVQVTYNVTAIGPARLLLPQAGSSGSKRRNLDVQPGPMGPPDDKDILDKADKSWNQVSKLSPSNQDPESRHRRLVGLGQGRSERCYAGAEVRSAATRLQPDHFAGLAYLADRSTWSKCFDGARRGH